MKKAYLTLLGVFIFLFILISAVFAVAFNSKYYSYQHKKNGVYEIYDKVVVDDITTQIVEYIKSERESLYYEDSNGMNIFSERELLHMEDVRRLFEFYGNMRILILSVVLASVIFLHELVYNGVESILKGMSMSLAAFSVLCMLAVFNFGYVFEKFHNIFFRNEFWILDSSESIVINILPIGFFVDASMWIFALTFVFTAVVIIALYAFKKHI